MEIDEIVRPINFHVDKEKLRAHDLKQETLGFPCECWSEEYIKLDGVMKPGYSIEVASTTDFEDVSNLIVLAELRCSKCTDIWSSRIEFEMNIDDPAYDGVLAVADWSDEYDENLTYHQCFPALDRLRIVNFNPCLVYADCVLCDADRWIGSAKWKGD